MSKLANALAVGGHGKFLAQAQLNLRGQHMAQTLGPRETNLKEVNVITTRSRKVIEPTAKLRESEKDRSSIEESTPSEEAVKNPSRVPFPQALKSTSKSTSQHSKILEYLKQVKVNLPLLHVISQVPIYAKVLKDLCTIKWKHHVEKTTFLTEHVNAVIEQKVPPKYKEPGCPNVSCIIGNHEIAQALLDLGASVNIIPYAIYSALGLGKIKLTTVVLQLADRSTIRPRGIVEDVLVQIDKLCYLVDFLVLDVKVDVNPEEDDGYHQTYMIDTLVEEEAHALIDPDPLNFFLLNFEILARDDNGEYPDIDGNFNDFQDYGIPLVTTSNELV
ncbi:uncharacterized protein LOC111376845 [Olea europaea var. sylvestris]|uniref:uncharacterized protein LOC111376845 n=1 Tax=Olea europaea var. sylvestris TaxID=158386 RepID=UPI000C1CFD28|nr:uncharacterized protein LOC111376845 [Olea europaea var. sylvestris]